MKKAKILAFTLTLAMLLSALLVPVSAVVNAGDGDGTYSGDPTALLLKNATLDDNYQQSSWGTPVIDGTKDATLYKQYTKVTSNVDNKSSNASFDIWYTNDGTHLYFFAEVNMPSSKTEYGANDQFRLYLDFYNQHDKVYVYKTNQTGGNAYQTYIEANRSSYTNVDTLKSIQVQYNVKDEVLNDASTETYLGTKGTGYAFTKETTSYTLEGRILLPTYIKNAIAEGERPVIGLGYEIRNNAQAPQYVLGYFDANAYDSSIDEFNYIWDDYSLCPDMVLAAENNNDPLFTVADEVETNETVNVTKATFDVNGSMDDGEGWASLPYVHLDLPYLNATAVNTSANANVYLSTDGENLYAFVDSTSPVYLMYFYVQLYSNVKKETANSIDKFAEILLYPSGAGTSVIEHSSNVKYTTTDGSAIGQTVYAFDTTGKTAEIKMPLPEDVKTSLQTGDYTFKLGTLLRIANAENNGYIAQIVSQDYWFDWSNGTIPVTLPQTVAETSSEVQVEGFQSRDDGETDVRFVSSLKGNWEDYEALGFEFTYKGQTANADCRYVYESLKAGEGELDPANYGANYFFCYTLLNLEAGDYTFGIRSWTQKADEAKEYSASVEYSFTVNADGSVTVK